ncbi:MAG: DUF433 domain-containing protein [Armatimonadetes bacterium]|nr:DUF433 domain-containing protein [Armatimonadota bacterium]
MKKERSLERITANPKILGSKPIIRGTRISVEFILELLASGFTKPEILRDYPHLKARDIKACLEYAARLSENEIFRRDSSSSWMKATISIGPLQT